MNGRSGYWNDFWLMRPRLNILRPWLRCVAALTLLLWLGATAQCVVFCSLGHCEGHDEQVASASSHDEDHHGHDDSSSPAGHRDSDTDIACATLKSATPGTVAFSLNHPEFHLLFTLTSFVQVLDLRTADLSAPFFRQAERRDWVFTPVVCLGPAFRSLAPPVSSLT